MKTVLVHYTEWKEPPHYMLDSYLENCSKVVKVEDLTELNDLFDHIIKIDVLESSTNS